MDILAVTGSARASSLKRAIAVLRRGGVVVMPTETSYGLAADAANPRAVARVRRLKGRGNKPFALIAASQAMVRASFRVAPRSAGLMRRHWPGPLTLVLPARDRRLVRAGLATTADIGVRVPAAPVARALARGLGRPIIATSANVSGAPDCYALADFLLACSGRGQPDAFLDAGRLPRRRPSTVVAVHEGRLRILRRGAITPHP